MENRILELRKERNMTQMSLSTSIHVSQETISAYKTGRHDPTAENLIRIANFFQVSVDYLLQRRAAGLPSPMTSFPRRMQNFCLYFTTHLP